MANLKRTIILFIILHIYIALAALVFQCFEYEEPENGDPNLRKMTFFLMKNYNISEENAEDLISEILKAKDDDHSLEMRAAWGSIPTSIWFVMILFTTVGTGHIVPQTFCGRLFCMLSSLFGIPLYALFLKYAGEQIIFLLRKAIDAVEKKVNKNSSKKVEHMNIKVLISAFMLMTSIILIGALGSFAFKWTYFEGIYFCFISLSTVGFGDIVPTISDQTGKIFSVVYMFYNIVGLAVVSCFISSLVNSMEEISTLWRSLKIEVGFMKGCLTRNHVKDAASKEVNKNEQDVREDTGQTDQE